MKKIIVNDLGKTFPKFNSLFEKEIGNGEIQFLCEQTLTATLKEIVFKKLNLGQKNTLFLYPGESARRISSFGFSQGFFSEFIYAKRIWMPSTEPVVLVNGMGWGIFPEIENIVVVDDVISSGKTMKLVRERNSFKFPRATWFGASPISRINNIRGFAQILFTSLIEEVNGKKIPINSLSTLVANPQIRKDYFARNFSKEHEKKFLTALG